jgi:hypothetical protein
MGNTLANRIKFEAMNRHGDEQALALKAFDEFGRWSTPNPRLMLY